MKRIIIKRRRIKKEGWDNKRGIIIGREGEGEKRMFI